MKTIWKFPVKPDFQTIPMPRGAEVLTVQEQRGDPQVWAIVDPAQPIEPRAFMVVGTGHDVPEPQGRYVGTFQLSRLVFHLFEEPR